ncbi:hypothetical protein SYNPS1DRAFT_28659 [Syncephalis pseudoplumigaleata]|uniref:SCP domain-containing protein n=1 Tax=Syncephalis pseudoplumigaleata TaxID=1712513 RepID=A0A4P9Z1I0_9FUNG|nr:hypothetical protein SYNPS1DRAFT_28659 [Syncephalis pseudoplumigaleata]|eukprot:RKP25611.1 hypothetical protein SYNPS1DRAFT_28659 [Syncephalis pseudoplumigaleata]
MRLLSSAIACLAFISAVCSLPIPDGSTGNEINSQKEQIYKRLNELRASHNLPSLTQSSCWAQVAEDNSIALSNTAGYNANRGFSAAQTIDGGKCGSSSSNSAWKLEWTQANGFEIIADIDNNYANSNFFSSANEVGVAAVGNYGTISYWTITFG